MPEPAIAPLLSLDHLGCVAADLDQAAEIWTRLGFNLCPRSPQRGAVPGQPGMHPWATSNRCALFERGYLELIGVTSPGAFNPWAPFIARGPGLHILALRCAAADSTYAALADAAPFLQPPVQREREVDVDGRMQTMRFRNIFSRDADCPEARYIVIEHQTPDYLWQPRYLGHDNGAVALSGATFVARDCSAIAARLRALGGPTGIEVLDVETFEARHGYRPRRLPGLHALEIEVRDLDHAQALLEQRGVPLIRAGDMLSIGPESTGGFLMKLVRSTR